MLFRIEKLESSLTNTEKCKLCKKGMILKITIVDCLHESCHNCLFEIAQASDGCLQCKGSVTPVSRKISNVEKVKDKTPEKEADCSICLCEKQNKALLDSCFHSFCFNCITVWSNTSNQCPLCRNEFSEIYHSIKDDKTFETFQVKKIRRSELLSSFERIISGSTDWFERRRDRIRDALNQFNFQNNNSRNTSNERGPYYINDHRSHSSFRNDNRRSNFGSSRNRRQVLGEDLYMHHQISSSDESTPVREHYPPLTRGLRAQHTDSNANINTVDPFEYSEVMWGSPPGASRQTVGLRRQESSRQARWEENIPEASPVVQIEDRRLNTREERTRNRWEENAPEASPVVQIEDRRLNTREERIRNRRNRWEENTPEASPVVYIEDRRLNTREERARKGWGENTPEASPVVHIEDRRLNTREERTRNRRNRWEENTPEASPVVQNDDRRLNTREENSRNRDSSHYWETPVSNRRGPALRRWFLEDDIISTRNSVRMRDTVNPRTSTPKQLKRKNSQRSP